MLEKFINFFRPDLSEVLGISFDGAKIYFVRIADGEEEKFEVNFKIDAFEKVSKTEQLAEKISVVCSSQGWKTSAIGFCLDPEEIKTCSDDVRKMTSENIFKSAKTWAIAHVGEKSFFDFIVTPETEEVWVEAISKDDAEKYISAWEKNSMTLRALTALPKNFQPEDEYSKAKFVAQVVRSQKSPNLFNSFLPRFNFIKISATVFAAFFIVLSAISFDLWQDYSTAEENLTDSRENLNTQSELTVTKKIVQKEIAETKKMTKILAEIDEPAAGRNILLKLGLIADGKTRLTKIFCDEKILSIEGISENPEEMGNYLSRLKKSGLSNARIENSSENDDGEIEFKITVKFEKQIGEPAN